MTADPVCSRCGHRLGIGRFCINCGHPVELPVPDQRDATAERPAVRLAEPPAPSRPERSRRTRIPAWLPWLGALGALALVAGIGVVLVLGGSEEPEGPQAREPSPTPTPTSAPAVTASAPPAIASPAPAGSEEVTTTASVSVPETAPPNQDVDGNPVDYAAPNMLDGVPETCWRMPGDGTDAEVVITLAEPTEVVQVGLVNGYAKTAASTGGPLDWYTGNRRILAVAWVFDDGSTIEQSLARTRDLQSLDVDPVVTSNVTLRILEVSEPGRGRASRDYTAISEVSLVGTPS